MAEAKVSQMSQYAAEFIGTFMLVLTIALVSGQAPHIAEVGDYGPFAIGAMLTVMTYSLGRISGGYFNPAITFAAAYQHVIHYDTAFAYTVIQFIAGLCGALVNRCLFGFDETYNPKVGPPDLKFSEIDLFQCPMIELFYTFMLTFVALNVAIHTPKDKSSVEREYAGLTIGFVILAGGYGAGRVSGGYLNPAATAGIDIAHLINPKTFSLFYSIPYIAAQYGGAFLSVTALHLVRKETRPSGTDHVWYHPVNLALKIENLIMPELAAEFIGTFFLTFTFGTCVMANIWAEKHPDKVPLSPTSLSVGAAYMVMIYAIGDVCNGGHFNPAVTLAVFFSGRSKDVFPPLRVAEYMMAQTVGACLAGAAYLLVFLNFKDDHRFVVSLMIKDAPGGTGGLQGITAEMLMTFVLCYVTLCVHHGPERLKSYYGFAIGSCFIAGGVALGNITLALINPAITIGAAAVSFPRFLQDWYWILYIIGQTIGAGLAAAVAKYVTHPTEYEASHTFSEHFLSNA